MKKIIFSMMIILAILASCTYMQTKKEEIKVPEIHKGTQGVVMEFLPELPPSEVYEGRYFEIMPKIYNKGAADIQNGMISIGYEEQQIYFTSESNDKFDLAGKSVFYPEGTETTKSFRAQARMLPPQFEHFETAIVASACYPYKTEATALVCIDTDITNIVRTKPCKTQKITFSGGQGAPVAVTSVEPKMLVHEDPERIQPEFIIKLENLGKGQAMVKDKVFDACTGKPLGEETWNKVELRAALSDVELNCRPEKIKLTKDQRIVCTLEGGIYKEEGTYLAPLSIEVNYGYMDRMVKGLEIKKIEIK
ncbi:hypothetical protein KY346_02880 [Candidatus Woesearchaeota archaeon]|nr:hypothetical protein [Candidatus Woesearchaeota archaeon]